MIARLRDEHDLEHADQRDRDRRERDDPCRSAGETRVHVPADDEEEEQESRAGEVPEVAQTWDQLAGRERRADAEGDERQHRPVGGGAVDVQAVRRDLPHQRRRHEHEPQGLERRHVEPAQGQLEWAAEQHGQERRREKDEQEKQSEREPPVQQLHEGAQDELDVEDHAPIADVEDVVAQLVPRMGEIAAPELRQAGHPRPDDEARGIVLNLAHGGREKDRADWAWSHEIHRAPHDVQELRNLVELGALQEATDGRVESVARRQQARPDPGLGIDQQRAKLVDAERLHVAADACALVQHGAAARELGCQRDRQRDGERHQEPRGGDQHLPPATEGTIRLQSGNPEPWTSGRHLHLHGIERDHLALRFCTLTRHLPPHERLPDDRPRARRPSRRRRRAASRAHGCGP